MDSVRFPIINQEDFESFRKILSTDLPATYVEWLQWEARKLEHYRGTHIVRKVKVYPEEFQRFLDAGTNGYGLNALYKFAEIKDPEKG